MDNERPGVRHRRHPPDRLHPWVFRQHQVWVDYRGTEHEIECMPLAYVLNVWSFCLLQADRIRAYCLLDEAELILIAEEHGRGDDVEQLRERVREAIAMPPGVWLRETPLMRALERRLLRNRQAR